MACQRLSDWRYLQIQDYMVVTHKIARISDLRGRRKMAEPTCGPEAWREPALWVQLHWFRFPTLSLRCRLQVRSE